MTHYMISNIVW